MENRKSAVNSPKMENLEEGKSYAWCACGQSEDQLWCNGAHKGSGIGPTVFKEDVAKTAAMCMCKQTNNPPYCDGAHTNL